MKLPRKLGSRFAAGILAAAVMVTPAMAAAGTVNADGGLRLRTNASTNSDIITLLPNGTSVEVLGDAQDGWYQVSYSGWTGYVSGDYLNVSSGQVKVAAAQADTVADPSDGVTGTVNAVGGLRLRNGSGTSAAILTVVPNGTVVPVSGITEDGWFQVTYKGTVGYVSGEYLELDEDDVQTLERVGDPIYGRVTDGPLNIRSGPSTDYPRVRQLRVGAVVQIIEENNGWYQIADGFISGEYIEIIDAAEAAAATTASGTAAQIVEFAKQFLGYPYVYGGTSPRGFDCSGFAKYVYSNFGITLNRTASAQMDNGTPVSKGELQPGDLVFFLKAGSSASRASHVGIYIGNGQFIHASTSRTGVIITDINSSYYVNSFVGGRRLV